MMRFLKVLGLVFAVMAVAGCGRTLDMSKTNFLDIQNAENPEIVFVIENKHFSDRVPSSRVGKIEFSSFKEISNAINKTFSDNRIAIFAEYKVPINVVPKIITVTPLEFDLYKPFGLIYKCEFIADVIIDDPKSGLKEDQNQK